MRKNQDRLAHYFANKEFPLFFEWYKKLPKKEKLALQEETGLSFEFDRQEVTIIYQYLYKCYCFNEYPIHRQGTK
jgi:hypothetical protein